MSKRLGLGIAICKTYSHIFHITFLFSSLLFTCSFYLGYLFSSSVSQYIPAFLSRSC